MNPSPWVEVLRARIRTPGPALHLLTGPAGVGKTLLVRQALAGHPAALHWEIPPLEEDGALGDLDRLLGATLGELPPVRSRPDLLPLPGAGLRWRERLEGSLLALAARAEASGGADGGADGGAPGRAGVLVLDGMEALAGARRRLPDEVLELWTGIRDRGLAVHLVVTWRTAPPPAWLQEGEPLELSAHPFRAAARAHGARTAKEGFQRWAIFGHYPAHLPRTLPPEHGEGGEGSSLRDAVVERILTPGGDLHDAPLHRLAAQVQVPRRYLEILVAVARGATGWGGMASSIGAGAGAGNRLAPYLSRLEADGWIRVLHPLDGRAGGRQRRYALADPFSAFWFGHVLPLRSLLHRESPERIWDKYLAPALPGYLALQLPELARRWIEAHAAERLPAAAREVGALWNGDVELDVAARLANGQVCYGICQAPVGVDDLASAPDGKLPGDVALFTELERKMQEVRWGMGREARAPLVFLTGQPSDELRRRVARTSLGRILTLDDLMGEMKP